MNKGFSNSNWSLKFPRTMQQAFGPYTDNTIYEPYERPTWKDVGKYLAVLCIISILFSLIIL